MMPGTAGLGFTCTLLAQIVRKSEKMLQRNDFFTCLLLDSYLFQGLNVWILPRRVAGLPSKQIARSSM